MSLAERLNAIRSEMAQACVLSGRNPKEVHLLAVSKLQPASLIEETYDLGIRDFGENYVQELIKKRQALSHLKEIRWHLIGPLQSNKSKQAVENADYFHALDSLKLANELSKRCETSRKRLPVFIQVNIDDEPTKSGVSIALLEDIVQQVVTLPNLELKGLMCIPEQKPDMRSAFRKMRDLAKTRQLELSMGMSDDFDQAIAEGANWIRVGTKLFGKRQVLS